VPAGRTAAAPFDFAVTTTTVAAPGARICVRAGGTGHEVVLLPSLGRGSADFARLGADLVAAGFRAVLPEARGIPPSESLTPPATLHDLASDVACAIRATCRAPVSVLGHALGNRIARTLASDHPDLVRDVILVACGGLVPIAPEIQRSLVACFAIDLPEEEHLEHVARAFFADRARAVVWRDGWYPEVAALQGRAVNATPVEDWWLGGGKETLVLQPACDAVAPPENARLLAEALGARVRVVEIPDAGHAALPEQPEAIARAVIAFAGRDARG
jgi:pimeloyl-ACP methyl ester carboxylesterase